MKIVIHLLWFWLVGIVCFASDTTHVSFSSGTWQEVLAKSKQQNKPVFIDFYTTWCGPCVRMSKEAFNDAQVGKLFNSHFINYKVDAEKGEGVMLAKQFNVSAYPTLIFVGASQQIIYRTEGYGGIDWLKEEAQKVIDVTGQISLLRDTTTGVSRGLQNQAYLKQYLTYLAKLRQPSGNLLNSYLEKLTSDELVSNESLAIMAGTVASTDSRAFDILLKQLPSIRDTPAGREALITMPKVIASDFEKIVHVNDEKALDALISKNRQLLQQGSLLAPELVEQETLNQRIDFYRGIKDYKKYHKLANFYARTQLMSQPIDSLRKQDKIIYREFERGVIANDSLRKTAYFIQMDESMKYRASKAVAEKLNQLAWAYYQSVPNAEYLQVVLGWIKRSIQLYPHTFYQNTLAHLLYKTGQKKEAIKQQEQAITEAREKGREVSEMVAALEKMRRKIL